MAKPTERDLVMVDRTAKKDKLEVYEIDPFDFTIAFQIQ